MKPRWEDLDARARGLSTHLLDRVLLDRLARVPDVGSLAEELRRAGFPLPEEGAASAAALDLAVRRTAAARLALLARWCGPRAAALTVVFEDEDRRSLRAILRGAVQQAPAEARLAGLIPTPALPERALEELARQPDAAAVAALLTAWKHPYGPALLRAAAAAAEPDLLRLEIAVNRRYAERAVAGARRAGRNGLLAAYVADQIDLENAWAALVLAGAKPELPLAEAYLPGGRRVTPAVFELAVAAVDAAAAAQRLAAAFVGSPLVAAFRSVKAEGAELAGLEEAVLGIQVRRMAAEQRRAPLGPAPVLAYALRLRAEVTDLRRIIWGVALGAPAGALP
jgi:vacuolar-type H+-ATPase subunit C/Vma6